MSTPERGSSDGQDPVADPFIDHPGRGGVDDPTIWLASFLAEAEQMAARAEAAQQAMSEQSSTVENRLMRMTMGPSGQITQLVFSASANAATAAQLTESFQELHTRAAATTTRETLRIMSTLVPTDDPSIQAIADAVSPEVREQMASDEASEDDPGADR